MANWLLKSEPNDYSYSDLKRDRKTVWDGVKNNLALKHMRSVRKGDQAFIYHTGKERSVVGIAKVVSDPYPDPERDEERLVVFDVRAQRQLPTPVPLADIKADDRFADFALSRNPRLSVMPVCAAHWKRIVRMGGG